MSTIKDLFNWMAPWSEPVPLAEGQKPPLFLMGFPRSGTTLLDQILNTHSHVQIVEEQETLTPVRTYLAEKYSDYPDCLAHIPEEEINVARTLYFDKLSKFTIENGGSIVADKLPLYSIEAALIYRLFPEAKIIFSLRHPCDASLSCFMQAFDFNEGMASFYSINDTMNFYDKVMTLWRVYEQILPCGVHYVKYEDLVDDLEGVIAGVIDFIGLEWEDALMMYNDAGHKRAYVKTPSYAQITEKVYSRARYRWLRYERHIGEAKDRYLNDHIRHFGYDQDTRKNRDEILP